MLLVITRFISENNLWKHGKLEVLMHGKSILWDVAKYAAYIYIYIYKIKKKKQIHHLNVFCYKLFVYSLHMCTRIIF